MWLRQFNNIINLFLVKQECSSGASFEKSRSIEPYANSSPNRFFPIDFLNTAFNEILSSATRTIHSFNSRSLLPFPLRSFLSQFILETNKVWKLAANPKKKTILWYRILRNFNLCHRLKLWRSSRQIFYFLFLLYLLLIEFEVRTTSYGPIFTM